MHSSSADGEPRSSLWLHVREFAVPPHMIEAATARRSAGDWAGACAAAGVDVDLDLRDAARAHGAELASRVRADLRHLAPDLLRWHLPRVAPDGLLRPGLTIALARYGPAGRGGGHAVQLVARTPPARAGGGQRVSLALWNGARTGPCPHPHPRPDHRFRLDLHRHLWNAHDAPELRVRSGADGLRDDGDPLLVRDRPEVVRGHAVGRWVAEATILLRAQEQAGGAVAVRLSARDQLVLHLAADGALAGPPALRPAASRRECAAAQPVLPDAATWTLPDLELLRAELITADRLHPLVAAALVPHQPVAAPPAPRTGGDPRVVACRGAQHRIGLVDGVLVPLDHDSSEVRREELLAALSGPPLPCLQAVAEAHRDPGHLVRARLDHGDTAGALAAVEDLLGPDALQRSAALRHEWERAALRQLAHGLFRAGLAGFGTHPAAPHPRRRASRGRPRPAHSR
jgi:hypothetical protein